MQPVNTPVHNQRFALPDGMEDLLWPQALCIEKKRHALLTCFHCRGYDLILPPMMEYLDNMFPGISKDLLLQTFKVIDQSNGEQLGIRADMTPQIARIDAQANTQQVARYCYIGSVLRTRSDGFEHSREPIQFGAELFGSASVEADLEIICLMNETLQILGLDETTFSFGHSGIYLALVRASSLEKELRSPVFSALQRKDKARISELLLQSTISQQWKNAILALPDYHGDATDFPAVKENLSSLNLNLDAALNNLQQILDGARSRLPATLIHFDLAELPGFDFHNGVLFAAYIKQHGAEIARGGRFGNASVTHGETRSATGFNSDLRLLLKYSPELSIPLPAIAAPINDDPALLSLIATLREQGERIVPILADEGVDGITTDCDRIIQNIDDHWRVKPIIQTTEENT